MIYAFGDIHGEYNLLVELYNKVINDISAKKDQENTIVFLGDYIDRGKGSIKVLDFLMNLKDSDNIKHVFIRGNHEVMFRDAMYNPMDRNSRVLWLDNGGMAFVRESKMDWQYFINNFDWRKYTDWIESSTKIFYESGEYVFVHGGLDIRKRPDSQFPDYVLWARHTQENFYRTYPKMVIHGHTPNPKPVADINRINVDTSYHSTKKVLTCVRLPNIKDDTYVFFSAERML